MYGARCAILFFIKAQPLTRDTHLKSKEIDGYGVCKSLHGHRS